MKRGVPSLWGRMKRGVPSLEGIQQRGDPEEMCPPLEGLL